MWRKWLKSRGKAYFYNSCVVFDQILIKTVVAGQCTNPKQPSLIDWKEQGSGQISNCNKLADIWNNYKSLHLEYAKQI